MQATAHEKTHAASSSERVAYKRLLWVTPLTALAAIIVALVIYAIASALGAIPQSVRLPGPMGDQPLTPGSTAMTALMATIWAAIVFAILGRLASRPVKLFRIVALVVLALSFTMPFTVPGIPTAMLAPLLLMHIAVAAVDTALLTTLGRSSSPQISE